MKKKTTLQGRIYSGSHVCLCVCMCGVHMCVCACRVFRCLFPLLCMLFPKTGSQTEPGAHQLTALCGQQILEIPFSASLGLGLYDHITLFGFSHRCWGSELILIQKVLYSLRHLLAQEPIFNKKNVYTIGAWCVGMWYLCPIDTYLQICVLHLKYTQRSVI